MIKIETNSMSVFDIRISPNQDKFACALVESSMRVFQIDSGAELITHNDINFDSAWSVDWQKVKDEEFVIAAYGNGGYIRAIDMKGDERLKYARKSSDYGYPHAAQLHSDSVWKLRVLDDQSYSVSDDGSFTRLHLEVNKTGFFSYSRKKEKRLSIYGNLYDLCFFDKSYIIIAQENVLLKLSKEEFSSKTLLSFRGHKNRVVSICKLDDQRFISGSWDNTLKIWDIDKRSAKITIELEAIPYNLLATRNNILHTSNNQVVVREKINLNIIKTLDFGDAKIRTFDLSQDLKTIVAGDEDGMVYIKKIEL